MVLFIFEIKKALKILLRILPQHITVLIENTSYELFVGIILFLTMDILPNVMVVVFLYGFLIMLSLALKSQRMMWCLLNQWRESTSGGKISYSYFTLEFDLEPNVKNTFPRYKLESDRVDAFSSSLQRQGHIVHYLETFNSTIENFPGVGTFI